MKPAAMSIMNDIVVVSDEEDWNTMIGDTFQYYFASAFPIMPQPEPFFDLRHFSVEQLNAEPLRKQLRTYVVLVNLDDSESATTKMVRKDLGEDRFLKNRKDGLLKSSVGKDKWARNQIVIYLMGRSEDELVKNIKESFSAVAKRINIHDEDQLKAKIYSSNVNLGLSKEIKEKYGIDLSLPADYKTVMSKDNFTWFRKDTKDATLNLIIKKIAYQDPKDLTTENILSLATDFGLNVDPTNENNNLLINDEDLPIMEYTRKIDDNYTLEVRGIWEMSEDFVGGPFVSYLIHNEKEGTLLNAFTFVFAPGKEKRDLVQQLDYLVKQIKFTE